MEESYYNFENRISALDTSLFSAIHASLTEEDKKALLAIELDVRKTQSKYCYLEIGSYLGGSILPYLVDPKCYKIYSVDKRPLTQPHQSLGIEEYPNNSTQRMMDLLKGISEKDISKIKTFDSDASKLQPDKIKDTPDVCFIDGEHTNRAVISDFNFVMSVIKSDGLIVFHDAYVINKGLETIIKELKKKDIKFRGFKLVGNILVIGLRDSILNGSQHIRKLYESSYSYFIFRAKLSDISGKSNKQIRIFIKVFLRPILNLIGKLTCFK